MQGAINMASHAIAALPAPAADNDAARKKYVDDAIAGVTGVPSGVIAMWSGLLANIPAGWKLCDGTAGTPNLSSRFIIGAAAGQNPGGTGGSNTHNHTAHPALSHSGTAVASHSNYYTGWNSLKTMTPMGVEADAAALSHRHTIPTMTHTVTQPSQHAAQSHAAADNVPVYYALAFIMKS